MSAGAFREPHFEFFPKSTMQIEESPAPPTPASAAASSSPDASQENDQSQANALGLPCAVGEPSAKQQETRHPARRRGGGAVWKARSRGKLAAACGSGGSTSCSSSKFVSPEAVLAAARELKDKLPEVSPELLERLKARGLEPCTLQQVLDERGLQWAATQVRVSPSRWATLIHLSFPELSAFLRLLVIGSTMSSLRRSLEFLFRRFSTNGRRQSTPDCWRRFRGSAKDGEATERVGFTADGKAS